MSFGNDPGVSGRAKRKAEVLTARSDVVSARRLAERRSFFLRLIDRLLRRESGRDGPPA